MLPEAVTAILNSSESTEGCQKTLERNIERDPAISAKILRVANSAVYGVNGIGSIGRAIAVLGVGTVRSLVLSVAYQNMVGGAVAARNFDHVAFWQHSLAAGTAARIIARIKMPLKAEEIYSAAMMHDIGMLVLDKFSPQLLETVISTSIEEERPMHEVERDLLKFTHADLGGMLAARWGLTPIMKAGIERHHGTTSTPTQVDAIIYAANLLAHLGGYPNQGFADKRELPDEVAESLGMPAGQFEVILTVMRNEVEKAKDVYHVRAA